MLDKIFHTERYLGKRKKKNYFEGWYFRCGGVVEGSDPSTTPPFAFAFIVAVSKSKTDPHSFVQYIDRDNAFYFRFTLEDFSFDKENMTIRVADNIFSKNGIKVNCCHGVRLTDSATVNKPDPAKAKATLTADIAFSDMVPFRKTFFAPNVMGPFAFLPMPCRHAVVSPYHRVFGSVAVNGRERRVSGSGYIEKDYGDKFPKNYIWMQAFAGQISIMSAVAWPLAFKLRGFMCLVLHNGKQYNFSLYKGAKLKVDVFSPGKAVYSIQKGKNRVDIDIADNEFSKTLISPIAGGAMAGTIQENLCAGLKLRLVLGGKAIELPDSLPCAFDSCI
ncbi:MAG: hypothetical protein FWD58_04125 [Firmicutes bacterium]|nr:hypothetical protein [Bacillota bacterium]